MSLNLDKINAALDRLNPEKNQGGGGGNNDAIVKLPEGSTTIRIVPYKYDPEMPFRELHFHYGVGGKTFLCPNRMNQETCPICDVASKMWNKFTETNDETFKDAFKKLVATLRVYVPIIVRGEEDLGVRWWAISPRTTYKDILTIIRSAAKQGVDITDPTDGRDLTVNVEKGFNDWLVPKNVQVDFSSSKLANTKKEIDKIVDSVKNIDEIYGFRSEEEMSSALGVFFQSGSEEEENSLGKTRSFGNTSSNDSSDDEDDMIDFDKPKKSVEEDVESKFDRLLGDD